MQCYLTVGLICISLTASDDVHLFMCSPIICVSSFMTCLSKSSARSLIRGPILLLCCFYYYNTKSFLYVLNISPLSDLCFTDIFSKSMACFPRCSLKDTKVMNFGKVHFTTFFSFVVHGFCVWCRKSQI